MKVWAWRTSNTANFGDELGPAILQRLGYEVERVENIEEASIVACGSILEYVALRARVGTVVWGSGAAKNDAIDAANLDVRAVRGELTRRAIGATDVAIGDPGILVPQLWGRPAPRYGVGVLRHYVDKSDYSGADAVMDADRSVDEVIDFIGSCRSLLSSSLHGLVVANAWRIPCLRLHHPEVAGGDFKWIDWWSSRETDPHALIASLQRGAIGWKSF